MAIRITVTTFRKTLAQSIKRGRKGIDDAINHYIWARHHLKELHQRYPDYTQEDTRDLILRELSVNSEQYIRVAGRFGGGVSDPQIAAGRKVIRRFGMYETFKADKLLGPEQMIQVAERADDIESERQFAEVVLELHKKEIDSIEEQNGSSGTKKSVSGRVDLREENNKLRTQLARKEQRIIKLESDLHAARHEIKTLSKRLEWFESNVKVTTK